MPEITGDTANGRSISVVSRFLPGKSNFAIAQPAHTPNTRLAGTAIAAASSVRLQRGQGVGLADGRQIGAEPVESASMNTATSGRREKEARKSSATAVSAQRTSARLGQLPPAMLRGHGRCARRASPATSRVSSRAVSRSIPAAR